MALKDIFGQPNQGAHKYRIFGFAAVDILLTILLALLITYFLGFSWYKLLVVLITLLIVAELIHAALGVQTKFITLLTGAPFPPAQTKK